MRQRIRKAPMSEINVVPYIDVMLVLLIIFMITAPLLTQGVKVDLPQVPSNPIPASDEEPIIVNVDKVGNYYLSFGDNQDKPISATTLVNRLNAVIRIRAENKKPPLQVLVGGDKAVPYGKVVELMALLQKAGVPSVGMITETPEQ